MGRKSGGIRANCSCHVYNNATDQVFVGWAKNPLAVVVIGEQ